LKGKPPLCGRRGLRPHQALYSGERCLMPARLISSGRFGIVYVLQVNKHRAPGRAGARFLAMK
jgi:hypothetical protein